jgi:hypothetical protein
MQRSHHQDRDAWKAFLHILKKNGVANWILKRGRGELSVSRLTSWLCSVLAVLLDRWARVSGGHPLLSHCYRCEVPLKAKWPELAEGFVAHPKVCRGCAACFKFLHAKWAIFSCAAKYSRAGFAMCKLLTWQLPSNCNLLTSDNRPSVTSTRTCRRWRCLPPSLQTGDRADSPRVDLCGSHRLQNRLQ